MIKSITKRLPLVLAIFLIVSLIVSLSPLSVYATDTKLIGKDDATASTGSWANYIVIDQHTCSASGTASEVRIKVTGNVNVKVAIYADDGADAPGNRIAKQDTGVACASGWNTIALESGVSLTNGTKYWLAAIYDANYAGYVAEAGRKHRYKAQTYAGYTWSDTLAGLSTLDDYAVLIAGWSVTTCTLAGTATAAIKESDIVAGGKTIILTLTNATWVIAAGSVFDNQRQNIINGVDSAQAEAHGWDAEVKAKIPVTDVVRTSDTVVTITLTAEAGYDITAQEIITATIPATAVIVASAIVASPTFTIDFIPATTPTVVTNAVINVEETTATYNGTVTVGAGIDMRGFAWGTTSNATLPGNETPPASYTSNYTETGSWGTGNFVYNASGLTSADKYYERAYAHNTTGYGWGGEVSFFTKPNEPTGLVCTPGDTQVALSWTKATAGTGATMYTYIRYKAGSYPVDITDGTFSYNGTLSSNTTGGLTNGTAYYFVAWSWAYENGSSKWSDLTANCTSTPAAVPSVTTIAATLVEETTTTVSGNVTSLNGLPGVNVRGFQYDTDSGVPYSTNWTESGSWGTGTFSRSLTPLTSADFYYFRALSANTTVGYGYGSELSFFTKPNEPTGLVCTPGDTQVALSWTKATNGIGATMNTYIRYKAGSYPVDITDGTFSYNGTLSSNTTGGLTNGTAYYFVAWSWAYENGSSQWSDLTANCTSTPAGGVAVETHYCSGYSQTTAVLNGEVTSLLGTTGVSERGFDYGLTTGYGSTQTTAGSFGVGEFNESINGLQPATSYHFRAKAKSNAGVWTYGGDMMFATKGSPTLVEYWETGGDAYGANITGATLAYQTFTTNSTDVSRSIKSIKLSLLRVSTATGVGTVTASVRHTSNCTTPLCGGNYCLPTGADIVTATLDGDSFSTSYTWQEFTFTTEECLEANTTYAIVVSAVNGDASNYIRWHWTAAGGYGGGNAGGSTDSGVTWTGSCASDYLFEVWGNSCLEMEEAKVFTSYINSGDWLITVLYKNFYPPYYEAGADVSTLFYLQLVDGTTVKAQSKVPEWGYRPGCIYLSSTMVASLEWGKAYLVRIYGNFGAYPHMDYTLQPTDWMGSDLTRLDSWVRSVAARMEAYYGVTLTQYISGKGIVLNENGGVIFATNIPDLDAVRSNLFTIVSTTPGYETGDHTQTYARSLAWQPLVGAQLTRMWTSIGNAFGMSGSSVGTILVFAFYAAIAFMAFPPGHAIAAVVIPIPVLLFVWGTGLAQLALMAIILAVAIILLVWQFWWHQAG